MYDRNTWPPAPQREANPPAPHIVLYPARWKMALLALGGLLFGSGAPLMWSSGDTFLRAVAVLDVLFFGLCVAYALARLLWPRPSLVIDDVGVTDNASALGAGLIRWEEVEDVGIVTMGTNRFIIVYLRDAEAVLARQPWYKQSVMRTNLRMIGSPVAIPGHMTMSQEEVVGYLQSRLGEHHP